MAFLWLTTVLIVSDTPRFRATIDPFLLMLAAVGLSTLIGRVRRFAGDLEVLHGHPADDFLSSD